MQFRRKSEAVAYTVIIATTESFSPITDGFCN